MRAIPAVDLRGGACVQLVGGAPEAERVRLDDPVAVAVRWRDLGFRALHVVDLDAALGEGDNDAILRGILALTGIAVTVGGGVRSAERIEQLLEAGSTQVVVGTRAIEDPAWLAEVAGRFPDRLVLAADVRGREVATRGWTAGSGIGIEGCLRGIAGLPLAAVLVTAVHQEGRLAGPDLPLIRDCAVASPVPLIASGGITTLEDLRAIQEAGAAGAVLGMALYTGALDPAALTREFAR